MPRIVESIGRGIVGVGRAIRGGAQGGAAQVTPPPMDEVPRPDDDDTGTGRLGTKRNLMQRVGSKIVRDAQGSLAGRGIRALRSRAAKRSAARSSR